MTYYRPKKENIHQSVRQSEKKKDGFNIFEDGILSPGETKKAYTSAAYLAGIAVGIFLIHPGVFGLDSGPKTDKIQLAFYAMAYTLMAYAVLLLGAFFFARDNIRMVRFAFNWLIVPTVVLGSLSQIFGALYDKN